MPTQPINVIQETLSLEELSNELAKLQKILRYLLNGQLDFENITARGIKAENIEANTITTNELAANSVTAEKISVSQLSAISANLGTITAGLLQAVSIIGGTIQGGQITGATIKSTELLQVGDQNNLNKEIRMYVKLGSGSSTYVGLIADQDGSFGLPRFTVDATMTRMTGDANVYGNLYVDGLILMGPSSEMVATQAWVDANYQKK